ncbi:MAG: hypothetical protein IKF91_00275, partial [Bacilli bacterium]|nr:hypothetical protein [Bacilli bacterium]
NTLPPMPTPLGNQNNTLNQSVIPNESSTLPTMSTPLDNQNNTLNQSIMPNENITTNNTIFNTQPESNKNMNNEAIKPIMVFPKEEKEIEILKI